MKEARCIKTQAINKQVASGNGMAVCHTLCTAEYRFLLFAIFRVNPYPANVENMAKS